MPLEEEGTQDGGGHDRKIHAKTSWRLSSRYQDRHWRTCRRSDTAHQPQTAPMA
ncbi:hypothetical protein [Parabacteroides distasonis]|uniref:hypothetical protein n=1 Tax=Parabacteroides distasonis TaxID=823 RepID=UPI00374E1DC5